MCDSEKVPAVFAELTLGNVRRTVVYVYMECGALFSCGGLI